MIKIKLFTGYLKTKGKRPIETFKDDQSKLVKWETARRYESYGGVLSKEVMFFDIDSTHEKDTLLKIIEDFSIPCNVLETSKGAHFYFLKPSELNTNKIEWYSPIGISVTTKLGTKNVVEPLKLDGKTRRWIRRSNELIEPPKWILPLDKSKNHITEIEEGNRNQELFNYILKLQSTGMSKKEIRETIRIINTFVLKEPLPKNEIDTILRDEAFKKQSFINKNNRLAHDIFGDYLISEKKILRIENVLHIYKEGIYSSKTVDIERSMVDEIKGISSHQRKEVLSYLQIKAPEKSVSKVNYIAFQNGIFNLETWKLQEFNPDIVIQNKMPVNYAPDAYYQVTDNVLDKIACNDKALRKVLEEIFGYVLLRRNEFGKAFILTGDGSNGKSSYLKMLRAFVGDENSSALDLKELGKRFKTAALFGKLVNVGDDISNENISSSSEFKKLTTGEPLNIERKGTDPFEFRNYAKLIFSANTPPHVNDTSSGFGRRLMMIPFDAIFNPSDNDYDPFIQDKLLSTQSMEYMLQLAIAALKRLLKNKGFTKSTKIEKATQKYKEENNSVLTYISEMDPKFENEATADCYQKYLVWCTGNGMEAFKNIWFSREVCKQENLQTKPHWFGIGSEKKQKKIFVKK